MTAAIIYAAKSTVDDHGSIPTQLASARRRAEELGRTVLAEFSEADKSGYRGNRGPELEAAMEAAIRAADEDGDAELWVWHSSRLARGTGRKNEARSLLEIFTHLSRRGVTIRSSDPADDAYVQDGALIGMASKMSNKFSEDLAGWVQAGKRRRAERGLWNGGVAPYGYRQEGQRDECRLVPEAAEAAIVCRIFEAYAAGQSQISILRGLNTQGVPTRRGRPWAQGTLSAILCNPVYIGKIRHRDEVLEGEHEPIIEADLWKRVETLRRAADSRPGRGRGRRPKGSHLFLRGMLRCSCGAAMVPRTQANSGDRYQCLTRVQNGPDACAQEPVSRSAIDGAALRYFEQAGLDVDATREQFQESLDAKLSEIGALRGQAQREAMQKEAARERVEADYLAGEITGSSWEKLSGRLDSEIEALRAQVAQLDASDAEAREQADLGDAEAATLEYLTEIRRAIVGDVRSAGGIEALRAALLALFEGFTLHRLPGGPVESAQMFGGDRCRFILVPCVRGDVRLTMGEDSAELPKIPLSMRANNHNTANAVRDLFGPIPIGVEA